MEHIDREALGDRNNFEGTEYHLAYALWLLIHDRKVDVRFYQGNDILAQPAPIVPPAKDDQQRVIPLLGRDGEDDYWIQLKSTAERWRPTDLLSENLLFNFIRNALASQRSKRQPHARLVTQASVDRAGVLSFAASPTDYPKLNSSLQGIIERVQKKQVECGEAPETADVLEQLALQILRELAQTKPTALALLDAQIRSSLLESVSIGTRVDAMVSQLKGRLLQDATGPDSEARIYDITWLEQVIGQPLFAGERFNRDAVAVCTVAVAKSLDGSDYSPSLYASRPHFENVLHQFLKAPETLFVLVGEAGAGKSWAVASANTQMLQDRVRALVPGTDLDHARDLGHLLERPLNQVLGTVWDGPTWLAKIKDAAAHGVAPVITVDEITAPAGGVDDTFRRDLGRIVATAKSIGAKLILTCHANLWEMARLGAEIPDSDVFLPNRETRLPGQAKPPISPSVALGKLSHDEMAAIIQKHLPPALAGGVVGQLRSSAFQALLNPYLLTLYLAEHRSSIDAGGMLPEPDIDGLLDRRISVYLDTIASTLNRDPDDVDAAFDSLVGHLWRGRDGGITYADAVHALEERMLDQARRMVDELRRSGLVTATGPVRVADQILAERLFARLTAPKLSMRRKVMAGGGTLTTKGVVRWRYVSTICR